MRNIIFILILISQFALNPNVNTAFAFEPYNNDTSQNYLYNLAKKLVLNIDVDYAEINTNFRTHPWITWNAIKLYEQTSGKIIPTDLKIEIIYGSIAEDIDAIGSSSDGCYSRYNDSETITILSMTGPSVARASNHFFAGDHNAWTYGGKLTDPILPGDLVAKPALPGCSGKNNSSSVIWATAAIDNLFNWETIISKERSEKDKYRSIGHIYHHHLVSLPFTSVKK